VAIAGKKKVAGRPLEREDKTRARLLGRPMSALATVALEEYLGRAGRPVD
jgi:hypothetical protein